MAYTEEKNYNSLYKTHIDFTPYNRKEYRQ